MHAAVHNHQRDDDGDDALPRTPSSMQGDVSDVLSTVVVCCPSPLSTAVTFGDRPPG